METKWNTYFLRNKRSKISLKDDKFWQHDIKQDMFMKIVFRWEMRYNFEVNSGNDTMIMDFIFT